MVKNMKEKLELKTHCLKKINSAAKAAGKLKQKSYDEQRYNDCSEYKKIQNQLYLIKSLTISDMEKKGELKVMPRVVDEFGTVLKSYASLDDKYFFHSISEHQEIADGETIETVSLKSSPAISMLYLPYMKYLINQLDERYRNIYSTIIDNNFVFWKYGKIKKFLESLYELHVRSKITKNYCPWYGLTDVYICQLYLNGIKLCRIEIDINDEIDAILTEEDGELYLEED